MIYFIGLVLLLSLGTLYKLVPPQDKLIVAVASIMVLGWWILSIGHFM